MATVWWYVLLVALISLAATVLVCGIGGLSDIRALFRHLRDGSPEDDEAETEVDTADR